MKTQVKRILIRTVALLPLLSTFIPHSTCLAQGSLTPPGPPGPTFKTLDQTEPRTPISSLPLIITNAGSFYLTTNLNGGAGAGIIIQASGVTLDLMGFEMVGGTGDGIYVSGPRTNIAIRNGTVRNWPSAGVNAAFPARNSQFEALRVSSNGFAGILGGAGSVVDACTARQNSGVGIRVQSGSTITGCTTSLNTGDGISANDNATISGCTASRNNGTGIILSAGSTVRGCTASFNNGDGIKVFSGNSVRNNTCNGNGAGTNSGAGIHAYSGNNRIDDNHVNENDQGIRCSAPGNLVLRNTASGNAGPAVSGGATADYDFSDANTTYGPIVTKPNGALTFSGFEGHPWANFRH